MKKSTVLVMLLTVFMGNFSITKLSAQNDVSATITYQDFYDNLSPYGTWIEYPGYGHVWRPSLEGDFRPYLTNGYWNYSDDGWMWTSNYDWGWAPFHYGSWIEDINYGWLWIPGYEWSPAWVTWGYVDGYYAWAPLRPGINIGIRYNSWRPQGNAWNFVRRENINDRNIESRIENNTNNRFDVGRINVIDNFNTTQNHNYYYSRGPELNDVEKYSNQRVQPVSVRSVNKISDIRFDGNQAAMYRPNVQNPQPKEFRRFDSQMNSNNINQDRVGLPANQQRDNIERLPVYRAPQNSFRSDGGGGGRRR
ncbi:DUF6600 domain-containing protein [Flavobacterium sp.]|uniref:DUF6600 domain-containing protein n=1 Tax=Flavobacterium sp. TaxID=239 RepID=UPI003D1269EB